MSAKYSISLGQAAEWVVRSRRFWVYALAGASLWVLATASTSVVRIALIAVLVTCQRHVARAVFEGEGALPSLAGIVGAWNWAPPNGRVVLGRVPGHALMFQVGVPVGLVVLDMWILGMLGFGGRGSNAAALDQLLHGRVGEVMAGLAVSTVFGLLFSVWTLVSGHVWGQEALAQRQSSV